MAKQEPPPADVSPADLLTEKERLQIDNASMRVVMLQAQIELARRDLAQVKMRIETAHLGYVFDLQTGVLVKKPTR